MVSSFGAFSDAGYFMVPILTAFEDKAFEKKDKLIYQQMLHDYILYKYHKC